jgi:hypothetical protein
MNAKDRIEAIPYDQIVPRNPNRVIAESCNYLILKTKPLAQKMSKFINGLPA